MVRVLLLLLYLPVAAAILYTPSLCAHALKMKRLIAHENDPGIDEPMTPVAASGRVLMEG